MKKKLFFSTLISYLGIYVTMPVLSAIATKAHMIPGQIGIMISLGAVSMLIFAPLWGKISDIYGRKIVMIVGLLGMSIFFSLYVYLFHISIASKNSSSIFIVSLMVTRFFLGIFMTTTPTAANAYMADISPVKERAKDMSSLGFATGLAMVLGPIIGGLVSSGGTLYMPFYITIAFLLLASFVLILILPKTEYQNSNSNTDNVQSKKRKLMSIRLLSWLLVGCSVMFVIVALQLLTSLYLHDIIGQTIVQSAKSSSLLFVILGITLMFTQILQIKILNLSAKKMMLVGIPLLIIGLLFISMSSYFWMLIVSYIFIGAGAAFGMSSLSAGASLVVNEDQQGAVAGTVAMTQAIAGIISPLLGSFIYQLDNRLAFVFFAVFAVITYIVFCAINSNSK